MSQDKMIKKICMALLAASLTVSIAQADTPVIDVSNLAQTTLTAVNTTESLLNEAEMLVRQMTMIENQLRNLVSNPMRLYWRLSGILGRIDRLVNSTRSLSMNYQDVLSQYNQRYPGWNYYVQDDPADYYARVWWWNWETQNSIQDALESQGLAANIYEDQLNLQEAILQSDNSEGALSAIQAGNQISTLLFTQLADLKQILASSHRQQSVHLAKQTHAAEALEAQNYTFWRTPTTPYKKQSTKSERSYRTFP